MKLLRECIRRFFPRLSPDEIRKKVEHTTHWCSEHGCRLFVVKKERACLLNEIADPPALLFVRGNPALLGLASLAVVGTRNPTAYGRRSAFAFAREMSRRGMCIVSGLARGIDSAAHRGVLATGGLTVAVLGHGLDRIYPAMNRELAEEILEKGGALVSEYPPGVPPLPPHFPARNRIISGLSVGALVVEAALKSGSLITARHALEQNREVFVVPGQYDDRGFQGSLGLIQQGAKLVRCAEDLCEEISWIGGAARALAEERWEKLAEIFRKVDYAAGLDALHAASGWPAGEVSRELLAAIEAGLVLETGPQQFLWTGWD